MDELLSHGACRYIKDQNNNFQVFEVFPYWYLHPIQILYVQPQLHQPEHYKYFSPLSSNYLQDTIEREYPRFTILQEVFLSKVSSSAFSSKFSIFLSLHNELV